MKLVKKYYCVAHTIVNTALAFYVKLQEKYMYM